VHRRTLWLDIRIMLGTVCKVLHFPLAVPRMLLQLPTLNHVEGASGVAAEEKAVIATLNDFQGDSRVAADEKAIAARCGTASVTSVS
jgi:hypothetical protein